MAATSNNVCKLWYLVLTLVFGIDIIFVSQFDNRLRVISGYEYFGEIRRLETSLPVLY